MRTIKAKILYVLLFAIAFLAIGEIDFRLINHEQRLEYDIDDELYFKLSPNQTGYEWMGRFSFKSPSIHINALGLRNPDIDLSDKSKYRILTVGSSMTFGLGVKDSEAWSSILQRRLNEYYDTDKYEVLNGANFAWGPYQYDIFLRRYVSVIKPSLMIVILGPGDIELFPFQNKEEGKKVLQDARIRKQILSASPFGTYCYRKIHAYLTRLLKYTFAESFHKKDYVQQDNPDTVKESLERQKKYISNMAETARINSVPLMIFVNYYGEPNKATYIYNTLKSFGRNESIYYCWYLGPEIFHSKKYEQMLIPHDGHFNAEANYMLAEAVFDRLKDFIVQRPAGH